MRLIRRAGKVVASILMVCIASGCVQYHAFSITRRVRPRSIPRSSARFHIAEITGWGLSVGSMNTIAREAYPTLFAGKSESIPLRVVCSSSRVKREDPYNALLEAMMGNPITILPAMGIVVGIGLPYMILFGENPKTEYDFDISVELATDTAHDPIPNAKASLRSKEARKSALALSPLGWLPQIGSYEASTGAMTGNGYWTSNKYKAYSAKVERLKERAAVDAVVKIISDMPRSELEALGKVHYKNTFEP